MTDDDIVTEHPAGDGAPPACEWAMCPNAASYRTRTGDGELVYVCAGHYPFTGLVVRLAR